MLVPVLFEHPAGRIVIDFEKIIGWPALLILAGITWIIGVAVQSAGEMLSVIWHHPREYDNSGWRYARRNKFAKLATPSEVQQAERYAIIKEASGNGATAILIGLTVYAVRIWCSTEIIIGEDAILAVVFSVLTMLALGRTNRIHARKQYEYIDSVIKAEAEK